MELYRNLNGDSNVYKYEVASQSITVRFYDGMEYVYDYESAGADAIEAMKLLAQSGRGLNSYITQNVRKKYASRAA
jgi:hypothetical protein